MYIQRLLDIHKGRDYLFKGAWMGNKYCFGEEVHIKDFRLLSHGKGEILWWYLIEDTKMKVSNKSGKGFHIFAVKGTIIGSIWRGRATKDKGGTVMIIPPLQLCTTEYFDVPEELTNDLLQEYEPKMILVDTGEGIKRLIANQ